MLLSTMMSPLLRSNRSATEATVLYMGTAICRNSHLKGVAEELRKKISVRLHHPVCKGWAPRKTLVSLRGRAVATNRGILAFHENLLLSLLFGIFFCKAKKPRSFAGTSKCHETNSKDRFHGISVNLPTRKP